MEHFSGVFFFFVSSTPSIAEGDIGVCSIGQFFMRYFGNFNIELQYCGILQTCRMHTFLYVLVYDSRYKNASFTFFRPFLAVSCRFGSNLKQLYFVTHFNLQFHCFNNQFKAMSLFPWSHGSFFASFLLLCQRIYQLYRLTMKLQYFLNFLAVLRYLPNFFCGYAVFSNLQCPPHSSVALVMPISTHRTTQLHCSF